MAIERRIIEGIEACRPGSDDLLSSALDDVARQVQRDPAAADAYRRAQAWDTAIGQSMEQVPLPSGLAERILARLEASSPAAQRSGSSEMLNGAPPAFESDAPAQLPAPPQRRSRRAWLAGATAVAATVLVAVGLVRYLRFGDETPVEIMADEWLAQIGSAWQVEGPAPQGFDVPPAVRAEPVGWQRIGQFGTVRGVAYKLTHPTAGTARLLVVRMSRSGLPATPPSTPQSTTGGRSIGYWRSGELVYVLVVDGNEQNYRQFVDSSRMPLA